MNAQRVYAMIIQGALQSAPSLIHWHSAIVLNPAGEKLMELGYRPVRFTEPGSAPDGFRMEEHWQETNVEIIQTWEPVPIVSEQTELTAEDALEILLGGEESHDN